MKNNLVEYKRMMGMMREHLELLDEVRTLAQAVCPSASDVDSKGISVYEAGQILASHGAPRVAEMVIQEIEAGIRGVLHAMEAAMEARVKEPQKPKLAEVKPEVSEASDDLAPPAPLAVEEDFLGPSPLDDEPPTSEASDDQGIPY